MKKVLALSCLLLARSAFAKAGWEKKEEPQFGISFELPAGNLIRTARPDSVEFQNYRNEDAEETEGVPPGGFFFSVLKAPKLSHKEINEKCEGRPQALPRVKGGLWCPMKPNDPFVDGSSRYSHLALVFVDGSPLLAQLYGDRLPREKAEAVMKSIRLLPKK